MVKNNLLSERLSYVGDSHTPTHLHLCSYNAEGVSMYEGKEIDELTPYLEKEVFIGYRCTGFGIQKPSGVFAAILMWIF